MTDEERELTAEDLLALLAGGMLAGPRIINLPYWVYVDGSDLTIRYTPINPEDYWNDT